MKSHLAMKNALAVGLAMCLINPVFAQNSQMKLGDLQQICNGSDLESKAACKFYIMGYTQGIKSLIPRKPCVPDSMQFAIIENTVKSKMNALLQAHPTDANMEASGALAAILINLYQCPAL